MLPKILLIVCLAFVLSFAPIHTHKAGAWLEFAGQILNNVLAMLRDLIKGIIQGMLKQVAFKMSYKNMTGTIGGSSAQGSMVITNFQDFIIGAAKKEGADAAKKIVLNDWLSGKGSSSYIPNNFSFSGQFGANYEGVGDGAFAYGVAQENPTYGRLVSAAQAAGFSGSSALSGNYAGTLKNLATSIIEGNDSDLKMTYVGNPSQNLFSGGNFKNLSSLNQGINWAPAFLNKAAEVTAEKKNDATIAKSAEATAGQGYEGKKQGGQIVTPGSLVGANMANVSDLGNKVIAGAQSIPEVITSMVQQMISQTMQQGIGNIQSHLQKENFNVQSNISQMQNSQVQSQGPGALYGNGTAQ